MGDNDSISISRLQAFQSAVAKNNGIMQYSGSSKIATNGAKKLMNYEVSSQKVSRKPTINISSNKKVNNSPNSPSLREGTREENAAALDEYYKNIAKIKQQKKAQVENLKASNGLSYGEAKRIVQDIESRYAPGHNGSTQDAVIIRYLTNGRWRMVEDSSPEAPGKSGVQLGIHRFHHVLDRDRSLAIPEPDRTNYMKAKAAIAEIERNNSSLIAEYRSLDFKYPIPKVYE